MDTRGALPESILESELLGHVRDLTGREDGEAASSWPERRHPVSRRCAMTPSIQWKASLRALQERTVVADEPRRRFASMHGSWRRQNRDLETDVAEHRFREDLYYRVNVVRVAAAPVPGDDIYPHRSGFHRAICPALVTPVRACLQSRRKAAWLCLAGEHGGSSRTASNTPYRTRWIRDAGGRNLAKG